MGKASKWLRGLFGLKKPDSSSFAGAKPPKKKWGFVKSYREKDQPTNIPATIPDEEAEDPSRNAIKLAAATAVVAEAAVASPQAAAEVVRLTSSGRAISGGNSNSTPSPSANNRISRFANATVSPASVNGGEYGFREDTAAVVIQSYFRGYLSKRALRALRALVRLQAIVRGRIWRKKYANQLNHWKELLRTHNLVNAGRVAIFESPHKGPATPEKSERMKNGENLMYKRNGSQNKFRTAVSRSEEYTSGIDHQHHYYQNVQPQMMHKPRNLFHSSHLSISDQYYSQGFEVQSSTSPFKFSYYVEDDPFWTAESSPQKRGTMTPTRSDGSRSCLSGYSDCPNYMTCTESSKAKTRSLSAPRQRPAAAQYERSSSTKARRLSMIHGYGQRVYPGSGRLDRMGMPVTAIKEEGGVGFSGGLWHRF